MTSINENQTINSLNKDSVAENTYEFFGYLLISQVETVESLTKLENKVNETDLNLNFGYFHELMLLLFSFQTWTRRTIRLVVF